VSRTIVVGQIHGDGADSAARSVRLKIRWDKLELSIEGKPQLKCSKRPTLLMSGVGAQRDRGFHLVRAWEESTVFGICPVLAAWKGHEVNSAQETTGRAKLRRRNPRPAWLSFFAFAEN
jgi:hypothetical protein